MAKRGPHAPDRVMPPYPMREVHRAQQENRDAMFHGACHGCAWQKNNSHGQGLLWCMECAYFDFNDLKRNLRTPMPEVDAELPEDF